MLGSSSWLPYVPQRVKGPDDDDTCIDFRVDGKVLTRIHEKLSMQEAL